MKFKDHLDREALERLPIEQLDLMAFGMVSGHTYLLDPNHVVVVFPGDLENIPNDKRWARSVSLRKPIEVKYRNGRFELQDGHHRWTAARLLGKKLHAVVTIDDNPIDVILKKREK